MGDPSSRTGIEQYKAARSLLHAWLLLRQGGLCIVCLTPLDIGIPQGAWGGPSLEHLLPASKGGTYHRHNLGLSHRECNARRSNKLELHFERPWRKAMQT